MSNKQLPYDNTSAESIWQYSAKLLGHTLREFAPADYQYNSGKGSLGQMVEELFFGITNNNRAEADFSIAGIELKCTPLKKDAKEQLAIKERLVCNMIDYMSVVNEDFEESHFYKKCQLMLLLFYLHINGANKLDLQFLLSILWSFPDKDLAIIKQDYQVIVDKIKEGRAHELSEGDTMYLAACRKGQKNDALRTQPYSTKKAAGRAFSLKPAYMRIILDFAIKTGKNHINSLQPRLSSLVLATELQNQSFDEIILNRFSKYIGVNYQNIATLLNINLSRSPKNKFAILASAIACNGTAFNVNKTEEFLKAGMMMKVIRVQANGIIREAMAFENIDYKEVYENEEWIRSRLYEIFSGRFLFVVFKEQHKNTADYILENAFFWTMPQSDLAIAEQYWQHIRTNVVNNHIDHQYFWKQQDNRLFHVRPKAAKAVDRTANPLGENFAPCKKLCYWFNNDYVRKIVNGHANR